MNNYDLGSFIIGFSLAAVFFMFLTAFYLNNQSKKDKKWNDAFSELQSQHLKLSAEYQALLSMAQIASSPNLKSEVGD